MREGEGVELNLCYDGNGGIRIIHDQAGTPPSSSLDELNLSVIRKAVSFSIIKVRTYPICIGDNPACSDGLPLAMDWEYLKEYSFTVDYYERKLEKWAANPSSPLQPGRYPRKSEQQLRISANDRLQLLWDAGFLPQEINQMTRSVNIDRKRRQASIRTLQGIKFLYFWETVGRVTRNSTIRRSSKKREREFLKPYKQQQQQQQKDDDLKLSFSYFSGSHDHNSTFYTSNQHHQRINNIAVTGSADTASFTTSTPNSVLSYNGEILFPSSPTKASPLAQTIRDRRFGEVQPRTIDMTGQVSSTTVPAATYLRRSPTVKRKNHGGQMEEEEEDELLIDSMDFRMDMDMDRYSGQDMDGYNYHNSNNNRQRALKTRNQESEGGYFLDSDRRYY
jgi:hypothetical protein